MATFPNIGYDVVLVQPGTVVTASGVGPAVQLGNRISIRAQSVVTAVAGTTPSVTVAIETSHDGTTWVACGSAFTAQTAANDSGVKVVGLIDRYVHAKYTVSGTTPSITFGVIGEAV